MTVLTNIGRLFTASAAGVFTEAGLAFDDTLGHITWIGPSAEAPDDDERYDCQGALVTPGLIDAHTHPVYAGDRFDEIAKRSSGASYEEIAVAGGGIEATVAATRACRPDVLEAVVGQRLRAFLATGATTVEAKTGYHLDRDGELAAVGLLARLDGAPGLPSIAVTFLGAHARAGDEFASEVASWAPDAQRAGARFIDVFCDQGYFTIAQSRLVLEAGQAAGLIPRIHADELARTGGAELAAQIGAASADHLLHITQDDARRLAAAGVVATVCPVTALALDASPPARSLLTAGATLALGSDHNPGTSGVTDLTVVIALAVAHLDLSVDEALVAATRGGAQSLRLSDRGVIAIGQRADLVAWDASHEGAMAWAYGVKPRQVWVGGQPVESEPPAHPRT